MGTNIPAGKSGLTAAQVTTLAVVGSGWAQIEANAISVAIPAITSFKPLIVGQLAPTTAAPSATDPVTEGGAIWSASISLNTYFGQSVFQLPKTGKWSISFKGKLLGSGALNHDNYFGVLNAAASHGYGIGWRNASSSSKYTLQSYGSSLPLSVFQTGLVNGDANVHVFRIMFDGTTVTAVIDGTTDSSTAVLTGQIDEPLYPVIYAATLHEAVLIDCLVGYVG